MESQRKVVEGSEREVNQWLERAGWDKYLVDVEVEKLFECVAAPDEEIEPELWMIWRGMDCMVQECQQTVVSRAGLYIRFEAIRTEKHQTRYTPLKGYMDRKAVVEHARLWKQILMFIGRTQGEQEWQKPKYRLKKGQQKAWKHLWRVAKDEYSRAQGVVDQESGDGSNKHPEQEQSPSPSPSNDLSRACLDFCFSLLQEQYSKNKYSNVLVCGLAVLGVRTSGARWGWMGADNYPPILSKVIKIARFIVIDQAFRFSEQDIGDSSSDSGSSGLDNSEDRSESSRTESSGCLELVKKFMDQFMVRGTHSAMQWMLDLRTYGRKIHNNITAEGSYPTCART